MLLNLHAHSLLSLFPSLSKKQATAQNPNYTDTITVNTCPQKTLQSMRINHAWKQQLGSLNHIAWQVLVCTPNKLSFSTFNINQANVNDLFIFSSSWLPSPRF